MMTRSHQGRLLGRRLYCARTAKGGLGKYLPQGFLEFGDDGRLCTHALSLTFLDISDALDDEEGDSDGDDAPSSDLRWQTATGQLDQQTSRPNCDAKLPGNKLPSPLDSTFFQTWFFLRQFYLPFGCNRSSVNTSLKSSAPPAPHVPFQPLIILGHLYVSSSLQGVEE